MSTGDIPFIAPMKIKYLESIFVTDGRRGGVALLFLVSLSLIALTSSFGQLKTQRRVTGLQPGAAAEGSRVTLLADAPLNDYEGFRRGDRFYVKIPRADLMTGVPQFRADGFESVQVQKGGENLIVSFKLQPGASARIDQYGNRLDVVFSAPNRSSYNTTASSGTPGTTRQTSSDRGPDAAGPMPPGGSSASGERIVSDTYGSRGQSGTAFNSRFGNSRRAKSTTSSNAAVASASPIPSPATTFSPTPYSNYPPLTTATPAAPSQIAASRSGSSNGDNGRTAIMRWISANRLATLLGALILLSLIVYLATAIRRRNKNAVQAAGAKAKVQPKYSPNEELNELPGTRTNGVLAQQQSTAEPPAVSAFAATASAQDQPWTLTRPTIVSPTAPPDEHREQSTDQEEREVFEL
ncbi:MAG TPA: hypothetical protein VGW76_20190 [Pyrinomonadaceae bacterium]|nr:hypothetical protein [Pyrinomonadaceae bacterium]